MMLACSLRRLINQRKSWMMSTNRSREFESRFHNSQTHSRFPQLIQSKSNKLINSNSKFFHFADTAVFNGMASGISANVIAGLRLSAPFAWQSHIKARYTVVYLSTSACIRIKNINLMYVPVLGALSLNWWANSGIEAVADISIRAPATSLGSCARQTRVLEVAILVLNECKYHSQTNKVNTARCRYRTVSDVSLACW